MDIRKMLEERVPILFDGAMGTAYSALPGRSVKRCEIANLDEPETIIEIHKSYLDVGAKAIKTNTFSVGNDIDDGNYTLAKQIIEAGYDIAVEAAKDYDAVVFADLGPAPLEIKASAAENYIMRGEMFLAKGAKYFLLETLSTYDGVKEFASWLKSKVPDAFLIVSFAVGPDGFTHEGYTGREMFELASNNYNIDVVGFNCFSGPHHMMNFLRTLNLGDTRVSVMPNAGYPTVVGRHTVYSGNPKYFAQKIEQMLHTGASIVGGCCGTTPEHIMRVQEVLQYHSHMDDEVIDIRVERPMRDDTTNSFWDKLSAGKKVIAVEYDPPTNDAMGVYLEGVRHLRASGVDAITIADCPVGIPRVDSSLIACKLKRELEIEPIPHMTCRDRNLNAIKALLLGLSVEDIHNVLLVTGDPMPTDLHEEVKSVFNCNSRKLAKFVSSLDENSVDTPFKIYAALNINAKNFDIQLKIAKEKEENGVVCFMTQPVLSERGFENLKRARKELSAKILGGIYPIVSYRNACFMHNEITGVEVTSEIRHMYEGKTRDESKAIALNISTDIAGKMADYVDGYYIMTPFNRVKLVSKIIKAIKENGYIE